MYFCVDLCKVISVKFIITTYFQVMGPDGKPVEENTPGEKPEEKEKSDDEKSIAENTV